MEKALAEMEDVEGTVSSAEEGEKSARSLFIGGGIAGLQTEYRNIYGYIGPAFKYRTDYTERYTSFT